MQEGSTCKTGRKIVTKETQEGCLSFSINRSSELFEVLKNAASLLNSVQQAGASARNRAEAEDYEVKWVWLKMWSSQKQWYPAHLEQYRNCRSG